MSIEPIAPTMTVDTSAYASGDLIGGRLDVSAALGKGNYCAVLLAVLVTDKSKQNAAFDLAFFDADPSGTTFTDNAPFDLAAADVPKYVGHVSVVAGNYTVFANASCATLKDIRLPLKSGTSSATLYAAIVSRGTPTYANAANLKIKLLVDR